MNLAVVFCILLAFLDNTLLKGADAQAKNVRSSWDVISSLESLTKAVQSLEAKVQIQADLLNKTMTPEKQDTCFQSFEAEEEWQQAVAQSMSNGTIVALQGDHVEIWCVAAEARLSQIIWKRENGVLALDRVQYENYGKTLRIKNVEMNDAGTYVCDAIDGTGAPISRSIGLEVYAQAQHCHKLIESDNGNLELETLSTGCLLVIKLENTTGFRLGLHPLMIEPTVVIPDQNQSNSNFQIVRIYGSKNITHTFKGKRLAIVVPPGRKRTALKWTGLHKDDSAVTLSTEFKNGWERALEWEPTSEGTHKIFWMFEREMAEQLNWALNLTVDLALYTEHTCERISFAVLEVSVDGNVSEIEKTCEGSSIGTLMSETSSQVLFLLHIKSVKETKPRLEVIWGHQGEPIKKNVEGVLAGTSDGAVVVPLNSTQTISVSAGTGSGLAFDWNSSKIYKYQYKFGIIRFDLHDSVSEVLLSDQSSRLHGIAIEQSSGNFYYVNRTGRTITVCNNDATKCSLVVNRSELSSIEDIAVHSSKGFLFWSFWDSKLFRANLDGSNTTVLLDGIKIHRIDVDEQEDRIYWGFDGGIRSCDLDGQDIRTLPNSSTFVNDVAIDGDKVYYSNGNTNSVHITSKTGGSTSFARNLTSYPSHIALYGTRISNRPHKRCVKSKCEHLCVVMSPSTYKCMCPENQKLNGDGKTCQP